MLRDVRLAERAFDPGSELAAFAQAHPQAGGIASFLGQVRDGGGVDALELSHYAPLTLPGMESLADQAARRWDLHGLLAIHRIGLMCPGDPIVLVCAAARHRRDAIMAVDFVMDHLKASAWFWKRERRDGNWHWIEPRAADHDDLARWTRNPMP